MFEDTFVIITIRLHFSSTGAVAEMQVHVFLHFPLSYPLCTSWPPCCIFLVLRMMVRGKEFSVSVIKYLNLVGKILT